MPNSGLARQTVEYQWAHHQPRAAAKLSPLTIPLVARAILSSRLLSPAKSKGKEHGKATVLGLGAVQVEKTDAAEHLELSKVSDATEVSHASATFARLMAAAEVLLRTELGSTPKGVPAECKLKCIGSSGVRLVDSPQPLSHRHSCAHSCASDVGQTLFRYVPMQALSDCAVAACRGVLQIRWRH